MAYQTNNVRLVLLFWGLWLVWEDSGPCYQLKESLHIREPLVTPWTL